VFIFLKMGGGPFSAFLHSTLAYNYNQRIFSIPHNFIKLSVRLTIAHLKLFANPSARQLFVIYLGITIPTFKMGFEVGNVFQKAEKLRDAVENREKSGR
jgi:hypothetical protein